MERLSEQIVELEEWRAKQIRLTRRVLQWMFLGLILVLAGIGWGFWQIDNLIEHNRENIEHGVQVDLSLAEEQYRINLFRYNACNERNDLFRQQLRQDKVQLRMLIKAHEKDGNKAVAEHWKRYLALGEKANIIDCGEPPAPPENVLPPLPEAPRRTTGG